MNCRYTKIHKIFKGGHCTKEYEKSTPEANRKYCTKEGGKDKFEAGEMKSKSKVKVGN